MSRLILMFGLVVFGLPARAEDADGLERLSGLESGVADLLGLPVTSVSIQQSVDESSYSMSLGGAVDQWSFSAGVTGTAAHGEGTLSTLSGLASDTKVTGAVGFSSFHISPSSGPDLLDCACWFEGVDVVEEVPKRDIKVCEQLWPTDFAIPTETHPEKDCKLDNLSPPTRALLKDWVKEQNNKQHRFLSLEGAANPSSAAYLILGDDGVLSEATEELLEAELSVSVGSYLNGTTTLAGALAYTQEVSSGDAEILCPTDATEELVTCMSGSLEQPSLARSIEVQAQLRELRVARDRNTGIAPTLSIPVWAKESEDVTWLPSVSLEVPVYASVKKDGSASFGIRPEVSYDIQENDLSWDVGVFVGGSFGLR
ncbi:MAG: hypothetical protein H6739_41445 [Alphaproteobacteria bacterium]|nr:hypothetical protein [Alphaproteobacteria bacterium]